MGDVTVIQQQQPYGPVFASPEVNNHDSQSIVGSSGNMTPHDLPTRSPAPELRIDRVPSGDESDGSAALTKHSRQGGSQTDGETAQSGQNQPGPEYRKRPANWFDAGRIFQVWCPESSKHQRLYILVKSRNSDGFCFEVHGADYTHDDHDHVEDYNDPQWRADHVPIQNHSSTPDHKQGLYLNKHSKELQNNLWVHLSHADNIDFGRYRYANRGILDRTSLKNLSRWYVVWVADKFDVNINIVND